MTFILILASSKTHGWPAVIGGYASREQAEAAGREATMAHLTQEGFEEARYGADDWALWGPWTNRPWESFTVIPGNAASGQPSPDGE